MKTDNELIAEFMGWQPRPANNQKYWMGNEEVDSRLFSAYERSWDWLMPVVEKISRHVYEEYADNSGYKTVTIKETASPRTFAMQDNMGRFMVRFNRMTLHEDASLMTATYNAVVEFIEFHNANKK